MTPDWVPLITWDACYRRGLSCMEGDCWEYAIDEFKQAIDLRHKDKRNVRAYGMHFRDEYFPHRETGIAYYHLGKLEKALQELEISMSHTPSARAKYYLNQTRRSYLLATGQDFEKPAIHMEFPEEGHITNQTPFQIRGIVQDDHFVSAISINQNPVFIELAQPSIPFTSFVDLKEGWNNIEIIAKDLVDRESQKRIQVYLDQQGPLVILNPVEKEQVEESGQIILTALIYDRSGIVSFQLNHREVPRLGLDRLCLVEETITLTPGMKAIPFWSQDRAGNITKGEIPILPARRMPNLALRLACAELKGMSSFLELVPGEIDDAGIFFDIITPSREDLTTYYQDIFLEGEIEAHNGIYRIEILVEAKVDSQFGSRSIALDCKELSNIHEIEAFEERNFQELIQKLKSQNRNLEEYIQTVHDILQRNTSYYLNQLIPLEKRFTIQTMTLTVEDNLGNIGSKQFRIRKIPREEIFKSEQRMNLAIIPCDIEMDNTYNRDRQTYIYNAFLESFSIQERFNLLEEDQLPWYMIKNACRTGRICTDELIQQIGENSSAEGVICGCIQKWMDGIEIKAVFRETGKGEALLFHDVFSPRDTTKDIKAIISGLAIKFRDSFPMCTGNIIERDGQFIQVDIGSEKGLFPGMKYNIFRDEQDLISKASINKVEAGLSHAEVSEKKKSKEIQKGYRVRTR